MSTKQSPNQDIISILQKVLAMKKQNLSDMPRADTTALKKQKQSKRFAITAIARALEEISLYSDRITSGQQATRLPGVGKGIAARIDEYLATGKLKELRDWVPKGNTQQLERVFGLGPAQAKKLVHIGILDVAQLRLAIGSGHIKVPDHVIQGVLYYRELLTRIPRAEMDFYKRLLMKIKLVLGLRVKLDLLGSYRRGLADCGDLDVLVTSAGNPERLLNNFIEQLKRRNILVSHLGEGTTKFAGIILHPKFGIARRIDIRYVPFSSYYTALTYYTGSKGFNIMLRQKAISLGYKLSEYSLTDSSNRTFNVQSEKDIFDILQLPYTKPTDRNI